MGSLLDGEAGCLRRQPTGHRALPFIPKLAHSGRREQWGFGAHRGAAGTGTLLVFNELSKASAAAKPALSTTAPSHIDTGH